MAYLALLLTAFSVAGAAVAPQRYKTLRHGSSGYILALHQSPSDYYSVGSDEETTTTTTTYRQPQLMVNPFHSSFRFRSRLRSMKKKSGSGGGGVARALNARCSRRQRQCDAGDRKYRANDGSCNNLRKPTSGQAGVPFKRLVARKHSLANCGAGSTSLPNVRLVSRAMIRRGEDRVSPRLSMMLMVWGQLVDHDLELTPPRHEEDDSGEFLDCCAPENRGNGDCCPIISPAGDPFYGRQGRPTCMPFIRSLTAPDADCGGGRDVVNANTAWLDGSFVYGSDDKRAKELRAFVGGELKTSVDRRGREFPPVSVDEDQLKMEFGDNRGDVHPPATAVSTVFVRNHNRLAAQLARLQPHWDDERLFQEARKINSALIQHVTYTDFLDALLGRPNDASVSERARSGRYEDDYDADADGAVAMGFGTAAFRLHTYVSGHFDLRDENFRLTRRLRLRDAFHDAGLTMANTTYDDSVRGVCAQSLHNFDNVFSPEMTEWLFTEKGNNWGMDIAALNIQRGRDHQIPGYPDWKKHCNLGESHSWEDLTDLIAPELVHRLIHSYRRVDDVDLYVAGNMEAPVAGSLLGPTFHCLVREQFERQRRADRFFYSRPGQFTPRQLRTLTRQTLARVLCDNADDPNAMALPANVFLKVDSVANPAVSCRNTRVHPKLDINAWA